MDFKKGQLRLYAKYNFKAYLTIVDMVNDKVYYTQELVIDGRLIPSLPIKEIRDLTYEQLKTHDIKDSIIYTDIFVDEME